MFFGNVAVFVQRLVEDVPYLEDDGEPFLMRPGERLRRHAPARLPPANCQLQVIAAERETKVQKKKKKNPTKCKTAAARYVPEEGNQRVCNAN